MNLSAANRTLTLLSRIFDPRHPTEAYLPQTAGKPAFDDSDTAEPYFERIAPEEAGVSPAVLAKMIEALSADPALRIHQLMVLRSGRVLFETSFGAQDRNIWKYTFSACKSVTSLAVGILCDRGLLSTDEKLVDLFADRISPVQKLRLAAVTVEDLLTMRSGIVFNEAECMTDPDWIKCYLNSATVGEIGKTFSYNSLNTYMLAAIVRKKSNMSLCDFLQKNLFTPMGISRYFWETCPKGIEKGGWGLYILPEDLAKLGQLILQSGIWNGKQLISADYLRRAVTAHVRTAGDTGSYDYGYQMWVGEKPNAFLFNGLFGQNLLGFPDSGVLIVSNAGTDELFQQSRFYQIVTSYLGNLPPECPIPADAVSEERLRTLCRRLHEHDAEKPRQTEIPALPKPEPPKKEEPPTLWKKLTRLFRQDLPEKQESVPNPAFTPPPKPEIRRVPPFCHTLAQCALAPMEDEPSQAVGLLPMILQAVHNNYSRGLVRLSFSVGRKDSAEYMTVTYEESDEVHTFSSGFIHNGCGKAIRTQLTFHGQPFLCASSFIITRDEDGRNVFKCTIDFLETPCTRILKLFENPDGTIVLREEELPGAPLMRRAILNFKTEMEEQPVIGPAFEKIDNDYLSYRIRRTFSPDLAMKKTV